MKYRDKVKQVILEFSFQTGEKETVRISGDQSVGLFFSNRSVNHILGTFFDTNEYELTREQLIDYLGIHALGLLNGSDRVRLSRQLIEDYWNLEDASLMLPPVMSKLPACAVRMPVLGISGIGAGRPQVTGIIMELINDCGQESMMVLNPNDVEALVWSDRCVLDILAPYYQVHHSHYTRSNMIDNCGANALPLMNGQARIRISPELVTHIWNQCDTNNMLPPFMIKTPPCGIAIPVVRANALLKVA